MSHKFKVGDKVVVTKEATEVGFPKEYLGIRTISWIGNRIGTNHILTRVEFEDANGYVCDIQHIIPATKLHKALK